MSKGKHHTCIRGFSGIVWFLVEVFTKGYFPKRKFGIYKKVRVLYRFWKGLCKLGDGFARESILGPFLSGCINFGFNAVPGIYFGAQCICVLAGFL